jgi:UDP-4-amino-4,6-dideoxy-N-acetyl-beta-L-altrosamine N-acetyltransferase
MMNGIALRPVTMEDAPLLHAWRNRPDVRAAMFSSDPIPFENHVRWLQGILAQPARFRYFVATAGGRPYGTVGFKGLDDPERSAEWTFHVGAEDAPAKGGTAMLVLALDELFGSLGARRLDAEVLCDNARSLAIHRKLGLVEQESRRRQVVHDGVVKDVHAFAIMSSAWPEARARLMEKDKE